MKTSRPALTWVLGLMTVCPAAIASRAFAEADTVTTPLTPP